MLWKLKIQAILTKKHCLSAIRDRPKDVTDDEKWNQMNGATIFVASRHFHRPQLESYEI
ncbi:Peroxidase 30 [Dorcoceras hygrometricum]|uniref:Peroxidase 30 n=1 Tax=Dorcoceras hygrometricum TaxID=472368 RepID=A0A2Z7B542_9LAMI|nr:Peroxidase 30 [Dorcoceras hygrometricum]